MRLPCCMPCVCAVWLPCDIQVMPRGSSQQGRGTDWWHLPGCRCEVGQLISEDGQVRFYRGLYHGNPIVLKVRVLSRLLARLIRWLLRDAQKALQTPLFCPRMPPVHRFETPMACGLQPLGCQLF